MIEGIKKVFAGENALARQISLFSICGIAGLINGYFALYSEDITGISLVAKNSLTALLIIFALFFTGFEVLFMKERELPEVDMRSFKIALKKIPFVVFLIGVPLLLASLFTKYTSAVFIFEVFLTIPLTMMLAGFSYNYDNNDAKLLFDKFDIKDYFVLFLKWILVLAISYVITFVLIFIIFLIAGLVIVFSHKADANAVVMLISTNLTAISKLANYLTGILLVYLLSVGTLVWNYEVIKTYEK